MIEGINHLTEGQLGFANKRASTDLREFFTLTQPPQYHVVPVEKNASFFLTYTGAAVDPTMIKPSQRFRSAARMASTLIAYWRFGINGHDYSHGSTSGKMLLTGRLDLRFSLDEVHNGTP